MTQEQQRQAVQDIERLIRMIEIAITIGRYLLLIALVSAAVTIAIAAYNFAVGNLAGGIIASVFAVLGLIFLVQLRPFQRLRKNNSSNNRYHHLRGMRARRLKTRPKYGEAASA